MELLPEKNPQSTGHEFRVLSPGAAGIGIEPTAGRRGIGSPGALQPLHRNISDKVRGFLRFYPLHEPLRGP